MTTRSSILSAEGEAIDHSYQASTAYAEIRDVVETELHDAFFGTMHDTGKPAPAWLIAEVVAHAAKMAVLRTFLDDEGIDERTNTPPDVAAPLTVPEVSTSSTPAINVMDPADPVVRYVACITTAPEHPQREAEVRRLFPDIAGLVSHEFRSIVYSRFTAKVREYLRRV
jgi:hypothetical protein